MKYNYIIYLVVINGGIRMIYKVSRKYEHRLDLNSTTLNTLGFLKFCFNRFLVAILINIVRELPGR